VNLQDPLNWETNPGSYRASHDRYDAIGVTKILKEKGNELVAVILRPWLKTKFEEGTRDETANLIVPVGYLPGEDWNGVTAKPGDGSGRPCNGLLVLQQIDQFRKSRFCPAICVNV